MKALSILLVLLGLVFCTYAETCPPEEDLHPCLCQEEYLDGEIMVTCFGEDFETFGLETLKRALNSLSGKHDVELSLLGVTLGTVPSDFFDGIGIRKLELFHCDLDSLSDDDRPPLLGLESSLEELEINGCFTEENVAASLKIGHLQLLKELQLSSNTITELSDDWFGSGIISLQYLFIANNGIKKVGSRAFANLYNLKELFFDGNRVGSIPRSALPSSAQYLQELHLRGNGLRELPEDIFTDMPALHSVSLAGNEISRLEQRTWEPVWQQLDYIDLAGNIIECDSHLSWISEVKRKPSIYGKCDSPRELRGKYLERFIDSISSV